MNKLLAATLQQLNGGKAVELKAVPPRQLPLLYRSLYNVTVGELLDVPCCLLEDRHAARITPGMSEKHTQTLCSLTGKPAVYVTEKIRVDRRPVANPPRPLGVTPKSWRCLQKIGVPGTSPQRSATRSSNSSSACSKKREPCCKRIRCRAAARQTSCSSR